MNVAIAAVLEHVRHLVDALSMRGIFQRPFAKIRNTMEYEQTEPALGGSAHRGGLSVQSAERGLEPLRSGDTAAHESCPLSRFLGCGAGRNALPLAELGYRVAAVDLSGPMLEGARERLRGSPTMGVDLVLSPMAPLPFADASFDLVVAHGIWNLAGSGAAFHSAVSEAARVARPGAGLFLFTFSRDTLPVDAVPDPGESFVFSSWNGEPQCFLTEQEILDELARSGFVRDQPGPLTVHNRRRPGDVWVGGSPVIFEGTFRRF